MKRFIEVTVVIKDKVSSGHITREITRKHKRLIDLNTISTIYKDSESWIKLEGQFPISVSNESYDIVRDALLKDGTSNNGCAIEETRPNIEVLDEHSNIANKLCDLQHDHTWIKQAVCNLTAMMKKDNVGYKPALLIGCNDKDLDVLFSDCYDKVRKMQERIKELEKKVGIKTEQKNVAKRLGGEHHDR